MSTQFDPIEDVIAGIAAGEIVIVVDDDDRENEGDLIMAASRATPEKVAFMIRHTSGILCTPILEEDAKRLHLDPMVARNDAPMSTAFTVSIDYRQGLTTGISAEERANTIQALANSNVGAGDFVRPGHIFPLVARTGGVLVRSGHTEAGVDLATLAGLRAGRTAGGNRQRRRHREAVAAAARIRRASQAEDHLDRRSDHVSATPRTSRRTRPRVLGEDVDRRRAERLRTRRSSKTPNTWRWCSDASTVNAWRRCAFIAKS